MKFESFERLIKHICNLVKIEHEHNEHMLKLFEGDHRIVCYSTEPEKLLEVLYDEYPKTKAIIQYFCFDTEEKTVFYIDGCPFNETIENLWLECEGRLDEQKSNPVYI